MKKVLQKFSFLTYILFIGMLVQAQELQITGKVNDSYLESLPGVSIVIKGTTIGTVTNVDGEYSLSIPEDAETIVFSFVGMKTVEEAINGRTTINLTMEYEAYGMDEVVVTGYGTTKKANLTGAVGSVDFDNVAMQPAANTATLLQGQMTGVTVSNFSAQPGRDDPQIIIRGVGTLNAGAAPLILVDGVEVLSMGEIPASDIESVSVLKDAASASIYGVRAANGVVLVTTKRGTEGSPTVQFNQSFGWQQALVAPSLVNSWEQATILNLDATESGTGEIYTQEQIDFMKSGEKPDEWANTNWFEEMTRVAPMNNTYLSVSGSKNNVRYMFSGDYLYQDGILIQTGAKRYSFRSNVEADISKRVKIGINLSGNRRDITETLNDASASNSDNDLNYIIRRFATPTVPVKYSSGDWGQVDGLHYTEGGSTGQIKNPVEYANRGQNITTRQGFIGRIYADIEFFKNFHYKPSFSYSHHSSLQSKYTPRWETYDKDGNELNSNIHNKLLNSNLQASNYQVENLLTYEINISKHKIYLLAGQSAQLFRNDAFSASVEDFPNDQIFELNAGINNKDVSGWANELALSSYFGRVNYNFDNRYLFEFNYRYDGTSRMNEGNRWGGFPSASAGWVVSNENFGEKLGPVSFLKIRGSWGQLGNQRIGGFYPYTQTLATGHNYIWDNDIAPGVAITDLANPQLTWETSTTLDIGVDLNMFNDKLQIVADWFDKTSTDVLVRVPIPATVGDVAPPYQNVGEVRNMGWEVGLKVFEKIANVVDIYGGVNLSHVVNEVIDYEGLETISNNRITKEGIPIGSYYAYIADGYYNTEEELANAPVQPGNPLRLGDIRLRDISGPEGVPDGQVDPTYDRAVIGNPFPDWQYSFYLGAAYKGIDFNVMFQGIQGIDRYYWMNAETNGTFTSPALDYWTEDNHDASVPRWGNTEANGEYSSFYLKDASYLRMKNLEIGYTLPSKWTKKIYMERLRIYFSGVNMLTWTHDDIKDYDPEKLTSDDRNRDYPAAKVYSVGLNITF